MLPRKKIFYLIALTASLSGFFFYRNSYGLGAAVKSNHIKAADAVAHWNIAEPSVSITTPSVAPPSPASSTPPQTAVTPPSVIANPAPAILAKPADWFMQINIPAIGLTAPVVQTGLESDGSLHVPSNTTQAGWYKYGPLPGEIGPAVITAHLNYGPRFTPGVFANLHLVKIGDIINVTRPDGSVAIFTITSEGTYPQNNFPTSLVYNPTSNASLRLITCAGVYDPRLGHYTEDLVVFAQLDHLQN